jgi:hypothetical protein
MDRTMLLRYELIFLVIMAVQITANQELIRNVESADESLTRFEDIKKEVTEELKKLHNRCENVALEHVNDKMAAKRIEMFGRFVIIGTGTFSIILPVVCPPVAATGLVIGYIFWGKGQYMAIKADRNRAEKLKEIHAMLIKHIEKVEDAYKEVQKYAGAVAPYDTEISFADNMDKIEDAIKQAQKATNSRYPSLKAFINKWESMKQDLGEYQGKFLNEILQSFDITKSFVPEKTASEASMGALPGLASVGGDVTPQIVKHSLFEIFQRISVLVNGVFFAYDIGEMMEYYEMRDAMKGDGEAREKVLQAVYKDVVATRDGIMNMIVAINKL